MTITENPVTDPLEFAEPRRRGIGDAVRRYPFFFVGPLVVTLIVGAAAGLALKPTYSASSQLNVGKLTVSSSSIPGYATAIDSLATGYARLMSADQIVVAVAQKLHLPSQYVAARLSGTPVASSPIITVNSTGASPAQAIAIANTASAALVSYVNNLTLGPLAIKAKLNTLESDVAKQTSLQVGADQANVTEQKQPSSGNLAAKVKAQTALAQQQVIVTTDKGNYNDALQAGASATLVQVLNNAAVASSNRKTRFETIMFVALVIGILNGMAAATWRRSWRRGRHR